MEVSVLLQLLCSAAIMSNKIMCWWIRLIFEGNFKYWVNFQVLKDNAPNFENVKLFQMLYYPQSGA